MSESTSDQDRIERDLERTRSRMDNRLSELQDRLSPGQVLDDLMGYFRGSEGGDFARNLMDSVRGNPLPAALTGIGLTWLMASNPQPRAARSDNGVPAAAPAAPKWTTAADFDLHIGNAERGVTRQADEDETAHSSRLDEARGAALGIARQAQDTAATYSQRVQDGLAAARQSVTQGAHDLRDSAGEAVSRLGGSAQSALSSAGAGLAQGGRAAGQMSSNLVTTITDNPVLLGAVGLAIGALLGALVPQSDQEEADLDEMAGKARTVARTLAQDVVDRGGQAVQQALDAGRDSAGAHGLTGDKTLGTFVDEALSGDLAGNVKSVAQDVLKATDEGLHKQGGGQTPPPTQRETPPLPTPPETQHPAAVGMPPPSSSSR